MLKFWLASGSEYVFPKTHGGIQLYAVVHCPILGVLNIDVAVGAKWTYRVVIHLQELNELVNNSRLNNLLNGRVPLWWHENEIYSDEKLCLSMNLYWCVNRKDYLTNGKKSSKLLGWLKLESGIIGEDIGPVFCYKGGICLDGTIRQGPRRWCARGENGFRNIIL
jgi:hypothetical protein